jgi:hypothetical protein
MGDADPLEGKTPYEVLGVSESDTIGTIETAKNEAIQEYRNRMVDAQDRNDTDDYNEAVDALKTIDDAWEWVQENHDPPGADQPIVLEVDTTDPVVDEQVTVTVTGDGGPVETIVEATDDDGLNESAQTDPDTGTATFSFEREGPVQFTALTTEAYDDATAAISVDRREVALAFDDLPDAVEVNESVDIAVTAEGEAVDATVSADGSDLGRTGGNELTHAFESTGMYDLTANKQPDERATYDEATAEIEVTEEQVQLSVVVEGGDYEIDDEVVVHVNEDESGTAVPEATVTLGDETGTTSDTGEVRLPLTTTGTSVPVKATKSAPNEDRTYLDDETSIAVSLKQASLHIDEIEGKLMELSTLTVHVVDGQGQPLEGAGVTTDWGHDETTDADGQVNLELNDEGPLTITAEKQTETIDYGSDVRTIEIGEFTRELVIASAPSVKSPGDTATIHVTDNAGNDVANASVTSSEQIGKQWTTDSDGTVTFTVTDQPGLPTITVKKTDGNFDDKKTTKIRVLP